VGARRSDLPPEEERSPLFDAARSSRSADEADRMSDGAEELEGIRHHSEEDMSTHVTGADTLLPQPPSSATRSTPTGGSNPDWLRVLARQALAKLSGGGARAGAPEGQADRSADGQAAMDVEATTPGAVSEAQGAQGQNQGPSTGEDPDTLRVPTTVVSFGEGENGESDGARSRSPRVRTSSQGESPVGTGPQESEAGVPSHAASAHPWAIAAQMMRSQREPKGPNRVLDDARSFSDQR